MTGQSLIACEMPTAIGGEMDGQQHLYHMSEGAEVVVGLIEQTMPQTGTCKDTYEAIEEQRFEELHLNALLLIEFSNDKVGQEEADEPAQTIPTEEAEDCEVGVPIDVEL